MTTEVPAAEEEKKGTTKELGEESLRLHEFYRGKIGTSIKCRMSGMDDFSLWYTPGVATPCLAIRDDPAKVYDYTSKWNRIAVVSDGTRVLGLGDIGPKAALPVMEGKCLLFKYLGGVDAVPITLDTKDPDVIVETVKVIQPAYGGVNLEDFSHPKCFKILERLRKEAEIPVFHDDQQGTATVTLTAFLNALKVAEKEMKDVSVTFLGCGAAGVATTRLLFNAGVRPDKCRVVDSRGILNLKREDIESEKDKYPEKWHICESTNAEGRAGDILRAMEDADVIISLSRSDPSTIPQEGIRRMKRDPIVFALANPLPEIWPSKAFEAGARIVATGRSDFPNQVNNSVGFPAIFRGALDVRARTITDEMCVAAATALADRAEALGLHEENLIPAMVDREAFLLEAVAVGMKAQEQGVAGLKASRDELYANASQMIERSQKMTEYLMDAGLIKDAG